MKTDAMEAAYWKARAHLAERRAEDMQRVLEDLTRSRGALSPEEADRLFRAVGCEPITIETVTFMQNMTDRDAFLAGFDDAVAAFDPQVREFLQRRPPNRWRFDIHTEAMFDPLAARLLGRAWLLPRPWNEAPAPISIEGHGPGSQS